MIRFPHCSLATSFEGLTWRLYSVKNSLFQFIQAFKRADSTMKHITRETLIGTTPLNLTEPKPLKYIHVKLDTHTTLKKSFA